MIFILCIRHLNMPTSHASYQYEREKNTCFIMFVATIDLSYENITYTRISKSFNSQTVDIGISLYQSYNFVLLDHEVLHHNFVSHLLPLYLCFDMLCKCVKFAICHCICCIENCNFDHVSLL